MVTKTGQIEKVVILYAYETLDVQSAILKILTPMLNFIEK